MAVLRAASMTPPVFPNMTPAPEASPKGESKGISGRALKSIPSSFAQRASSLVVMTLSMSRISGFPRYLPAAFISLLLISIFFAVHGVKATLMIFSGSRPILEAKYVLIVGPCIPIGLFAEERFGIISGIYVSTYLTHAGQQEVNWGRIPPFCILSRSSLASSQIVRSAEKLVSST